MTQRHPTPTVDDVTPEQRLTIVRHLANGRGVDFTATATGLRASLVREIGHEHGWPREESLAKAADVLTRNLDKQARAGITERPDLEAAARNVHARSSKEETRNIVSRARSSDGHLNGSGENPSKIGPTPGVDDTHRVRGREPVAKLATDAKSTGHGHVDRHQVTGQPFDATAALLLRGRESTKKRTQALAKRISDQLADLRDRLDDEDRERRAEQEQQRRREREKAAREKEREEARAEVRRLEEQLREAKAKARGHNKGYAGRKQRAEAIKSAAPRTATGEAGRSAASAYTDRLTALGVTAIQVREWAATAGHDCPARGMVPRRVLDAYEQANASQQRRTA